MRAGFRVRYLSVLLLLPLLAAAALLFSGLTSARASAENEKPFFSITEKREVSADETLSMNLTSDGIFSFVLQHSEPDPVKAVVYIWLTPEDPTLVEPSDPVYREEVNPSFDTGNSVDLGAQMLAGVLSPTAPGYVYEVWVYCLASADPADEYLPVDEYIRFTTEYIPVETVRHTIRLKYVDNAADTPDGWTETVLYVDDGQPIEVPALPFAENLIWTPALPSTAEASGIYTATYSDRILSVSVAGTDHTLAYPVKFMTFRDAIYYWHSTRYSFPTGTTEEQIRANADWWIANYVTNRTYLGYWNYYLTNFGVPAASYLKLFFPELVGSLSPQSVAHSGFKLFGESLYDFYTIDYNAELIIDAPESYGITLVNLNTAKRIETDWYLDWKYYQAADKRTEKVLEIPLYGDNVSGIDWNGDFFSDILNGVIFGDNYEITEVSNVSRYYVEDNILHLFISLDSVDLTSEYPVVEIGYNKKKSTVSSVVDKVQDALDKGKQALSGLEQFLVWLSDHWQLVLLAVLVIALLPLLVQLIGLLRDLFGKKDAGRKKR